MGQRSQLFKGYSLDVLAKNRCQKSMGKNPIFSKGIALKKIDGFKNPKFSKGIALMFLPKIDGSKDPNFLKGIALMFCHKSMGQKIPTF